VTLTNVTIADNVAPDGGGGIWNVSTVMTLKNTIVAGNDGGGVFGDDCGTAVTAITSAGYNLDSDGSCGFSATGDISNTDPLLGPLTDNGGPTLTHAITGASPAVDAGNPATPGSGGDACEAVDQRKVARPIDGDLDTNAVCDVGAYEADGAPACSAFQCLKLDMDADFLVTVADLSLSNAPCNASGVMNVALDAVGDSNGGANGLEDQAFTIDFVSGWVTCPGPMYGGSSIPSTGFIEEQNDTTAGLDFPADVTLVLCLKIDTITPLGLLQNCGAGFDKSPIELECTAYSYSYFTCEIITTGGPPKFLDTSGVEKASIDGSDTIAMTVVSVLAYPGDSDGDGCPDVSENRPKSELALGGGRNHGNPWDYYDVNGDGVINLFGDILGVIQHFSLDGAAPYDVTFDRGRAPSGANPWNMTAPDGVINLFTDILGVIKQFTLTGCTDPAA